jgi:hypothetical protein
VCSSDLDTGPSIDERGRPARIYVYNIIPYFLDEAKQCGPNEVPKNTQGLKDSAVKEYNYIYTGLNEDVLEFDLNFNLAFLTTALSNFGQNPGSAGHAGNLAFITGNNSAHGSSLLPPPRQSERSEVRSTVEESPILYGVTDTGSRSDNVQLRVAQMFHHTLINQWTDLITAEMRIVGDPFFIPQQTGNYIGQKAASSPNLLTDGTMNYMENELFIVVNFKTPFDYQIEGATMEFPQIVPQFSGLFSCWAVTNSFSKGRFEQTIKLIRRRGQDVESTTTNLGPVAIDNSTSIVDDFAFYDDAILRQQRAQNVATGATVYDDAILRQQRAQNSGSLNVPRVSVGGVTFDPRTGVFPGQPASSATPIYDDAIFRSARNRTATSTPAQPVYDDAIMRLNRTQPAIPSRTSTPPRPSRPGQNISGQAAIDQRRAQRIDSQQGNSRV